MKLITNAARPHRLVAFCWPAREQRSGTQRGSGRPTARGKSRKRSQRSNKIAFHARGSREMSRVHAKFAPNPGLVARKPGLYNPNEIIGKSASADGKEEGRAIESSFGGEVLCTGGRIRRD